MYICLCVVKVYGGCVVKSLRVQGVVESELVLPSETVNAQQEAGHTLLWWQQMGEQRILIRFFVKRFCFRYRLPELYLFLDKSTSILNKNTTYNRTCYNRGKEKETIYEYHQTC